MAFSDLATAARTGVMNNRGAAVRSAVRTAIEHRKRIKDGDFSVFLFPLTLALADDFMIDILAAFPIVGWVFGMFFSSFIATYLFIFMWGRGRIWLRIAFFFITLLDLIPYIGLAPFNTISVLFAYYLAKKDANESATSLEMAQKGQQAVRRRIGRALGPGSVSVNQGVAQA